MLMPYLRMMLVAFDRRNTMWRATVQRAPSKTRTAAHRLTATDAASSVVSLSVVYGSTNETLSRRALLLLADERSQSKDLVVLLHGWNSDAYYFNNTGFWSLPSRAGVNVLCAEGLFGSWMQGWSHRNDASLSSIASNVELQYLRAAIQTVAARWPCRRVYAVGKSDGGVMALVAACALDEIAGVVSISGLMPGTLNVCPRKAPLNALLLQGMHDSLMPHNGGQLNFTWVPNHLSGIAPFRIPFRLKSARETALQWASASPCDDCSIGVARISIPPPITCAGFAVKRSHAHMGPACTFRSALWRAEGADHFWRHGSGALKNSAFSDEDAVTILDTVRNSKRSPCIASHVRPMQENHTTTGAQQRASRASLDSWREQGERTMESALASLKTFGWVLLPEIAVSNDDVDELMDTLSGRLNMSDYWPIYRNKSLLGDTGRQPISRWFHSATQRANPMHSLGPHNEHVYSGHSPAVVAFWGRSSNYAGGHTVLYANLEVVPESDVTQLTERRSPGSDEWREQQLGGGGGGPSVQFQRGAKRFNIRLWWRSALDQKYYVALPSLDVWSHAIYTEHFVWQNRLLLPYNWSAIANIAFKLGSGCIEAGRYLVDRYFFATIQPDRAVPLQLHDGDLLLVDNRRWTHSVLASRGVRTNYVAMMADPSPLG